MPGWPDLEHFLPPLGPRSDRPTPELTLRRPTEADHGPLLERAGSWFDGLDLQAVLPRLWLRDFGGSSFLAEGPDGRAAAFLVGFLSPDREADAVVHLIAVEPGLRRRGIGRRLVEAFADDVAGRGASTIAAPVPPDQRIPLLFFRALGFEVDAGPGTRPIYGVPAYPDWDGPGHDRALLVRAVARPERQEPA
jgi:GNAT superfamily N-acetyltransferase